MMVGLPGNTPPCARADARSATVRTHGYGLGIGNQLPPSLVYGLDIETDTTVGGLDPSTAAIIAVAVTGPGWNLVLDDPEPQLLQRLNHELLQLPAGVLVTWNGARFDLPFIADRAERCGVELGLRLQPDHRFRSHRDPLPGHLGGYQASWHHHRHLDAYAVYRSDVGASLGLPCGLKPLARMVGLTPVEVDRERLHELTPEAVAAYVASDAELTRELALRRWPTASRAIDQTIGA